MEVGATGGKHDFVTLDLFGPHMEHNVTQESSLAHSVHANKGIMVVPL